ncbi:MAG: Gfo/Idh/MocA family oxidoreductase [Saprospiraceae bacterium]|nr:Gfo/Idh/MocA family oxidoreductase [Saprospiraceae bacterium]
MSTNKVLNFAIVGTGAVAIHHYKSIQELPKARLVAVCSSTPERARLAEEKFGVPAYYSVEQLLERPDIDVVCICTASGSHLEPTLLAAAKGKHVITEKPLEISLERADKMIAACKKAGVKLACIFQNRFKPDFQKVQQAIEQGVLGSLTLGNAYIKWFRSEAYYTSSDWKGTLAGDGGAALINQGIHTIDLLLSIFGGVKTVYGKIRTVKHKIEGEDLGVALLQFENGALGTIEGSTAIYPGFPERLEIFGQKGSIVLEGGNIKQWHVEGEEAKGETAKEDTGSGASDPNAIGHQAHKDQIADMIEAILMDREPAVNGEEARRSLAVIKGIYASSAGGGEIELS